MKKSGIDIMIRMPLCKPATDEQMKMLHDALREVLASWFEHVLEDPEAAFTIRGLAADKVQDEPGVSIIGSRCVEGDFGSPAGSC